MRRSLAKRGLDGEVNSALAAILDAPSDPGNWRVSTRRPVKFVSTPRSQLAEMELTELMDLEVDILQKIGNVSDTIRSLDVDPNTLQRAYEDHLQRMQRMRNSNSEEAHSVVDAFSHLLLQDTNKPQSMTSIDMACYSEEALIRLHEIFCSRLVPGYDVLGYAEIRELFIDAGILPSPSAPGMMPRAAMETGPGSLRIYALADAFFDQGSYEKFVVQVIGDAVSDRRERRAKRKQQMELDNYIHGEAGDGSSSASNSRRRLRKKKRRKKSEIGNDNTSSGSIDDEAGSILSPPPPQPHPAVTDLSEGTIVGQGPGQSFGLGFAGFVELMTVLEREKHITLLGILRRLELPLSTGADRWRRRVEQALDFAVRIAVEERGPTVEEIELARAARELRKLQTMQARPAARVRKNVKSRSRSSNRGRRRRSKSPLSLPDKGPSAAEINAQKAERKAKIMARKLELEKERRADQLRAWKRRYGFDIDEVIDPWNLCIVLYGISGVCLTEMDAEKLLTPLLARERADDAEIFQRAYAAGRTKRLRVIVEKQGKPPREWPMRKTVRDHMISNKEFWLSLENSVEFQSEDPSSRPSSRASSRRGRRSREGSRPGSRGAGGSRPGSRGAGGSRPGSRGAGGSRPGSRGPNSRPGTAVRKESWSDMFAAQPVPASPQYWAHRAKLFLNHHFRRMRQVGRKVVIELKDYASKITPSTRDEAGRPGAGAKGKGPNLGKSKADRKARRKQKQEIMARLKQEAKENECTFRYTASIGGLAKAALDMSDKGDFLTASIETKQEKTMDLGDLLDDVEAPEECTTFFTMSLRVADGWYEHDEDVDEIDKAVVVVRRIMKLFFEKQIFSQLPFYHSYNVLYDPDRDRKHVNISIFFSATPEDIRGEWGLAVPLSSLVSKFEMKAIVMPAANTCFNEHRREDLILENDFRMRLSGQCKFKRIAAHRVLKFMEASMAKFFPYVGPQRRKIYKKKNVTPSGKKDSNTEKDEHWEEDVAEAVVAAAKAREKEKENFTSGDEDSTAAMKAAKIAAEVDVEDGAGVAVKKTTLSGVDNKDASLLAQKAAGHAEMNEDQGGAGIAPKMRRWIANACSSLRSMEKVEIDFAVPSLSRFLLPEIPDCWRFAKFGGLTPRRRAQLKHLVHGAGGLYDTGKLVWNAIFGDAFRWEEFERRIQAISELYEHGETDKNEELIYRAHQTFRWILPSISSLRLQSGEQGVCIGFENFMFYGFIPDGGMPSREQVLRKRANERAAKARAERERIKKEKEKEQARIARQEAKGIFGKLKK